MKIGFIDCFLSEWHADNYPAWISEEAERQGIDAAVAYAWAEKEVSPYTGITTAAWCAAHGAEAGGSMEEVCERSDALVLLSPDNAENHLRYAQTALRYGKPVYIDKTFAPTLAEAKAIFALAAACGTPVCSSSALRFADELAGDRPVRELATTGCGFSYETYAVHQLEMMVRVLGVGASRVKALQNGSEKTLVIDYPDGRRGLYRQSIGGDAPFTVSMDVGGERAVYRAVTSDYFRGLIASILRFFSTGTPVAPHGQTLEVIAILEAGRRALASRDKWVAVER